MAPTPTTSADIYRGRSLRLRRHPDPDLHRDRRHRQHRLLRSGLELERRTLEHGRLRQQTATRSRSAAAGESARATARSTSSLPRTALTAALNLWRPPNQPNLYLAPARLAAALHRHPCPQRSGGPRRGQGGRNAQDRRFPGDTPSGDFAAFTTSRPLESDYDNAGHSEIYRYDAAHRNAFSASPAIRPTRRRRRRQPRLRRPQPHRRRSRLLQLDRRPRPRATSTTRRTPTSGRRRVWATAEPDNPNFNPGTGDCLGLISTGSSPFDVEACSGSAPTAPMPTSSPATRSCPRIRTASWSRSMTPAPTAASPSVPPPPPCKASDECHGAGTPGAAARPRSAPSPAPAATGSQPDAEHGFVKSHGKCVQQAPPSHSTATARATDKESVEVMRRPALSIVAYRALAARRGRAPPAPGEPSRSTPSPPPASTTAGRRPPRPPDLLHPRPPGRTRGRQERDLQRRPRASSATPTRSPSAASSDFALDECPSNSQAGLITIHANYEGEPEQPARHRADLRPRPRARRNGALRLHRADPRTSRSRSRSRCAPAGDYGLRFTVSDITQLAPLAGAELTFWGFPAEPRHDAQRFPKGSPGAPAGLSRARRHRLHPVARLRLEPPGPTR